MTKIVVAGAGIIGICCALSLRRKGYDVLLVDRNPPAEETSYGNAGVICNSGVAPLASPEMLKQLPWLATNRDTRFRLHWTHAFLLLPWVMRFIGNCNEKSKQHCISALSYLLKQTLPDHLELLKESGSEKYLNDTGWLRLYRDENRFQATVKERRQYQENDVQFQELDHGQIRELEPHLIRHYTNGIWLSGTPSLTNPGQVCKAYADLFFSMGGEFRQTEISRLRKTANTWQLKTNDGTLSADHVVVALGASSPPLLKTVGVKTSLAIERGYHFLYRPSEGTLLNRSIIDTQYGFVMTPMEMGIRVTSASDFVARHTRPTPYQLHTLSSEIEGTLPFDKQLLDSPWMGHRPSTPDSLPIIGPTPGHQGLWQAFGHGHLGLTMGPTTGKLIAEAITGKTLAEQTKAFLPERFS